MILNVTNLIPCNFSDHPVCDFGIIWKHRDIFFKKNSLNKREGRKSWLNLTPAFSVSCIAALFRHQSTIIFRHIHHLSTCCLKSANHNQCMPMFLSCHFYANEPQVQKVMSKGCDWWISIRLVCLACRKMDGERYPLCKLHWKRV